MHDLSMTLFGWLSIAVSEIERFLDRWQDLLGALIGAAIPIMFFFFTKGHVEKKDYRNKMYKAVVLAINNVNEIHGTVTKFIDERLPEFIKNIQIDTVAGRYSAGVAFFPLFSAYVLSDESINLSTGSGYLDNELMQVMAVSKDFAMSIEDARRQFAETLDVSRNIALQKVNSPSSDNKQLIENIEDFRAFIKKYLLETNLKVYFGILIRSEVCLTALIRHGVIRWKLRFSPSFKYFKSYEKFRDFKKGVTSQIENHFRSSVEKRTGELWAKIATEEVPARV